MEFETENNWVGKVMYRDMCKKFEFDHMDKWYMQNSASAQENDTY